MLMFSLCLAPPAQAASSSGNYVYLYDNGGEVPNATCDWYAKVTQPMYVLSDGETDLVLAVTMVFYNGTGAGADGTYVVEVAISDGTTTVTENVSIATAVALTGNITFAAADLATLVDSTNGTVTYTLQDATYVELDSYVWDQVTINANQAIGALYSVIPVIISLFSLTLVISVLGGAFGKLNVGVGGKRKKSKGKKK
jgi:hypothetical protein